MALHIRDGRITDAGALRALAGRAGVHAAFTRDAAILHAILADRGQTLLVALDGERPEGAVHLVAGSETGEIRELLLPASARAPRHGRELLAEAGLWLASRGATQMRLSPAVAAQPFTGMAKAAGFSQGADGVWTKPLSRARQAS